MVIQIFNSYSGKGQGLEQLDKNRISSDYLKFKNNFLNFVWLLFEPEEEGHLSSYLYDTSFWILMIQFFISR